MKRKTMRSKTRRTTRRTKICSNDDEIECEGGGRRFGQEFELGIRMKKMG
ncbi:HTH domain-containing protein [Sesbania bispinosa]|nr:HTH domain-containing protein [Sesbania bispinosa]